MQIVDTWQEYSAKRRTYFIASLISGVVLAIVGVVIDFTLGWGNGSFLVNLLSSFASFLVGVPVALVVLSTLTAEREDNARKVRVKSLSEASWIEFVWSSQFLCNDEVLDVLNIKAIEVQAAYLRAKGELQKFVNQHDEPSYSDEDFDNLRQVLRNEGQIIRDLTNQISYVLVPGELLQQQWTGMISRWNILDNYVRIQRLEFGRGLVNTGVDSSLKNAMSHSRCPVLGFLDLHEKKGKFDKQSRAMSDVPDALNAFTQFDRDALFSLVGPSNGLFTVYGVEGYEEEAKRCANFVTVLLSDLNRCVDNDWSVD